jgi:hypothetical protein
MIEGLPTIAIATDSLRLLPPERVPDALLRWSYKPNLAIACSISDGLMLFGIPLMEAK